MKFVVSGGGTGGHVYPALAIIRGLQERWPESEFLYIGSSSGIEKQIMEHEGLPFVGMEIHKGIDRNRIFTSLLQAGKSVPKSFWQAWKLIRKFRPDAVIGTGGYVSFPVVAASECLGCPAFLHEQNAWPGITNRLLARKAAAVLLTFQEAGQFLHTRKSKLTGLPVRLEIAEAERKQSRAFLQLNPEAFTVLIFGGSLGAASINQAAWEMLPKMLAQSVQIVWITGSRHYEKIHDECLQQGYLTEKGQLHLYPYLYEMPQAMAASDLAVCRCGAATLSELQIAALPAVLVPYPYAAENHQEKNALVLVRHGAGIMVRDRDLNGEILGNYIEELRQDEERLRQMRQQMQALAQPDSLRLIVDEIAYGIRKKR